MHIERDIANLSFSLSESEKETKAGMEISQCKMTNWPYLAQFASDLFDSKTIKFLKQKLVINKFPQIFFI